MTRLRERVARTEVAVKCPTCGQSVVRIRERLLEMIAHVRVTLPEAQAKAMIETFRRIWCS